MNILNYIDSKNQNVTQLIKKINADVIIVDSLINLKKSNNIDSFIKIENQLNQYGGSSRSIDIIQVDNNKITLNKSKSSVTILSDIFTGMTLDCSLELSNTNNDNFPNYSNYSNYEPNEKINLLITKEENKLIDIKITIPMSKHPTMNTYLPDQLKSANDDEIKLKLYKSLILLDINNKYDSKFDTLNAKLDALNTSLDSIKTKIGKKLTDSSSGLRTKYSETLVANLTNIQSLLNETTTSYADMEKNMTSIETAIDKINKTIQ